MAKSTHPVITRLQRLTDAEDTLICNYRLLEASGRKLISEIISKSVTGFGLSGLGNVTELRGAIKRPESEREPARLELLTGRESDMVNTHRIMDPATKEAMDILFSGYLVDDEPRAENVVSFRR